MTDPCEVCPCRQCWRVHGLDREKCDACKHSLCHASGPTAEECLEWLLDALRTREVIHVGKV